MDRKARFKELREAIGLPVPALAEAAGVPLGTLVGNSHDGRSARMPSQDTLDRLEDLLERRVKHLAEIASRRPTSPVTVTRAFEGRFCWISDGTTRPSTDFRQVVDALGQKDGVGVVALARAEQRSSGALLFDIDRLPHWPGYSAVVWVWPGYMATTIQTPVGELWELETGRDEGGKRLRDAFIANPLYEIQCAITLEDHFRSGWDKRDEEMA